MPGAFYLMLQQPPRIGDKMTTKSNLQSIGNIVVLGGAVAFFTITGIVETIPNWKLKNYYSRALTFYADTSGNGKIEPEEEGKFVQDFVSEIKQKPGYNDFNLRPSDIQQGSADSRKVLSLLQEYRPVPPF